MPHAATSMIAAKLIAEGRARVATEAEANEFHQGHREGKARHDRRALQRALNSYVCDLVPLKE